MSIITLNFDLAPAPPAPASPAPEQAPSALDEKVLAMLQGNARLYPKNLEQRFARVLGRILELWDTPEIENYFTGLLIDNRGGNRQGFPPEVASEIFTLSMLSEKLRMKKGQQQKAPADLWQDADNPKRTFIEQQGYDFSPKGFMHSAEQGDCNTVGLFLSSGADINTRDERGWTPLMVSSFNGNEAVAMLLIRNSADIQAKDAAGYGSLHWAAFNGYTSVAKLLLEQGADVNARSNHGWTPLLQAATRGHAATSAQLITGGADVNLASNDGWSALHKAAANGHIEVVKLLLDRGADPHAEYQDGLTPSALALKNRHETIAALLPPPPVPTVEIPAAPPLETAPESNPSRTVLNTLSRFRKLF